MTISTSRQYRKQKIKENIYVYLNHVAKDIVTKVELWHVVIII
nr:MAG TPA: hypothetical protein [Caudoviricetes sp.]